jgi:cell division protein FtsW (lipid II flippase)
MGFTEVLTIIFIFLRVFEVVDWSWWLVLLPEIIAMSVYVCFFALYVIIGIVCGRSAKKRIKKFEEDMRKWR